MPVTPTTLEQIRIDVRDAIDGMTADHPEDSAERWIYDPDGSAETQGRRNYTIRFLPDTMEMAVGESALSGDKDAQGWYIDMAVVVGYSGLNPTEWENRAAADMGSLWELLHPRSTATLGNTGILSFAGEGRAPSIELALDEEDGGPIYAFIFRLHYHASHSP